MKKRITYIDVELLNTMEKLIKLDWTTENIMGRDELTKKWRVIEIFFFLKNCSFIKIPIQLFSILRFLIHV